MITEKTGKIVKGLGGLFEVRIPEPDGSVTRLCLHAKKTLHRADEKLLIGDNVKVFSDDSTPDGAVISEVFPRSSALIRPPLANLDLLLVTFAAEKPEPVLETVDKLIAIAEFHRIEVAVIITKRDLNSALAESYAQIYRKAGFLVFITSSTADEGIREVSEFVHNFTKGGKIAAFAGASGVGKSSLMNALFPDLCLQTSAISQKVERGKHTTRSVEIFDMEANDSETGFLADTPGFSLIDFERFDFFGLDDLLSTFRDIAPYRGKCRYADCAHVGESSAECAVAKAAEDGEISPSRLSSYRAVYRVLKNKNKYN